MTRLLTTGAIALAIAALALLWLPRTTTRPAPSLPDVPEVRPPDAEIGAAREAPSGPVPGGPAAPAPDAGHALEAPAGEPVPLENLTRWADDGSLAPSPGIDAERNPHLRSAAPERRGAAGGALRERLRVEHESEAVGHAGTRQKEVGRTDVSVGMPVEENVEVRTGVRVDHREDATGGVEDVEPAPSVGVEVRF